MTTPPVSTEDSTLPRVMTIAQAIAEYADSCKYSDNPPFYEMVNTLITRGYDKNFKNDSFFDALCLTHTMLMTSSLSVRILTGGGGSTFWKTLRKPFSVALAHLKNRGSAIRMIVLDPSTDCKSEVESMGRDFGSEFKYAFATTKERINHFVVCDSRMIRIEEPHDPIDDNSASDVIKASVNFKAPELSAQYERMFDNVWNTLHVKNS